MTGTGAGVMAVVAGVVAGMGAPVGPTNLPGAGVRRTWTIGAGVLAGRGGKTGCPITVLGADTGGTALGSVLTGTLTWDVVCEI
jgi:hypothetical protein